LLSTGTNLSSCFTSSASKSVMATLLLAFYY
jgi:hypothetical protein